MRSMFTFRGCRNLDKTKFSTFLWDDFTFVYSDSMELTLTSIRPEVSTQRYLDQCALSSSSLISFAFSKSTSKRFCLFFRLRRIMGQQQTPQSQAQVC